MSNRHSFLAMKNSSAESLLSVSDTESQSWLSVSDTESHTSLPLTDTEAQIPPPPYEDTTTPPFQNQITFGDILYWAFQSDWLLFWIILFNTGSAIFRLSQVEDILFLDELTINMIFSHIPLFAYFVLSLLRQNYQLSCKRAESMERYVLTVSGADAVVANHGLVDGIRR
ncbi:hypothetical protein G7Y79_00017g043800 [Physcia stellaris]|nr:hypothetical protein G7Y79_00017g043800 [Physcia stellaris]